MRYQTLSHRRGNFIARYSQGYKNPVALVTVQSLSCRHVSVKANFGVVPNVEIYSATLALETVRCFGNS